MRARLLLTSLAFVSAANAQNYWQQTAFNFGGSVYSIAVTRTGAVIAGKVDRIYRSTDSGDSWTLVSSPPSDVVAMATNDTNGYAYAGLTSSAGGVYRSINDGASWSSVGNLGGKKINGLAVSKRGYVYAAWPMGTWPSGGLFRSTDHGLNWTLVITNYDVRSVATDANGNIYAGTVDNGSTGWGMVMKSTDEGNSWTTIGWDSRWGSVKGIAADRSGNLVVAAPRLFRSTDNGATWLSVLAEINYYNTVPMIVTRANQFLVAAMDYGVYNSTNQGLNWDLHSSGLSSLSIYCMAINNDGYLFIGLNSSIYRSTSPVDVPPQPVLISPSNNSTNQVLAPVCDWNDLATATSYSLQLSTDSLFLSTAVDTTGLSSSQYVVPDGRLSQNTKYFWRVSGMNAVGSGLWSDFWKFTTMTLPPPPAPSLLLPTNGAIGLSVNPTLAWYHVVTGTQYRLQIAFDFGFASLAFDDSTVTDTSFQITTAFDHNTLFYWRVTARNTTGWGSSSEVRHFTTIVAAPTVPLLISPIDGVVGIPTTPTLIWDRVLSATAFRLQVSADTNFTTMVYDDSTLTDTTRQITPALANDTKYFWRVNAKNAGGTSPYSVERSFTTILPVPSRPSLVLPLNGAVGVSTTPLLVWNRVGVVDTYRLQVATDTVFSAVVYDDTTVTDTSRQVAPALQGSHKYFWRVNAKNVAGWGDTSLIRSFRTQDLIPPATPSLVTPSNGSVGITTAPTLVWHAVTTASRHRLQMASDTLFTVIVLDDSTITDTAKHVISPLAGNTKYFWRVSAKNGFSWGSYSPIWSFRTTASGWTATMLVADAGGMGILSSRTLMFGQVPGATDGLDTTLGELELPPVPPSNIFDARFKLPLPLTPVTYSWKDFRSDTATVIDWLIKFQPGLPGYPMTFRWSRSGLPQDSHIRLFLRDQILHGGIVNVDMRVDSSYTLTNPGITALEIHKDLLGSSTMAVGVSLSAGWNMISNPVTNPVPDDSAKHLFPSIISRAFRFSNGYIASDTMANGVGYWGKFPGAVADTITGAARTRDSISVVAGWNMVGSISGPVDTSTVVSIPAGLRASSWFGYSGGYAPVTQIASGKGYWVKANGTGRFVLASGSMVAKSTGGGKAVSDVLNSLTITDAKGNSQTLYFGTDANNEIPISMYVMPPLPPMGAFDARFETLVGGTQVQTHGRATAEVLEFPLTIQSEAYPVMVAWHINSELTTYELTDGLGGKAIRQREITRDGSMKIENHDINRIVLKLANSGKPPANFALFQNYPNPFNPSTTIKYDLPKDSRVTLKLFNILGQEVATLVNGEENAGYKSIEWNASGFASGVYFYRIQAGDYTATRKLLLLK
jgi:hypothetical protein